MYMNEHKVRMRRLNKLIDRFRDGYYNRVTTVGDILFFQHDAKKRKNCVNVSGLDVGTLAHLGTHFQE